MRFRFRPVLTTCTALGVLVLLGLGTWQVMRLQWKLDLIEAVEARTDLPPVPLVDAVARYEDGEPSEYLPVRAVGGFPTDRTAHVFGTYDGVPGWFVFQPMLADVGSEQRPLLINRGFVAEADRQRTYTLPSADAMTGLLRPFNEGGGVSALVPAPDDAAVGSYYGRGRAQLAGAFADVIDQDALLPFYLDSTLPTALPRGGTTRLDFSNRHLGYAITWYGLALGLIAVFLVMSRAGPEERAGA